jgi:hypothetical protein
MIDPMTTKWSVHANNSLDKRNELPHKESMDRRKIIEALKTLESVKRTLLEVLKMK